jgi:hypothetical protein
MEVNLGLVLEWWKSKSDFMFVNGKMNEIVDECLILSVDLE